MAKNAIRFHIRTLLLATTVVAVAVAAAAGAVRYAHRKVCENHARSCLVTVENVADRAIQDLRAKQPFGVAIDSAEYILYYYPVGSVLSADHPFASEYEAGRRHQIDRIRNALREAAGDDQPTIWKRWKAVIE